MRQGAAFQFIQELIGDYAHVMKMSENPSSFYVETAIQSLHAAADVFLAIEEHRNSKKKKETADLLQDNYERLASERMKHYCSDEIQKIDLMYEEVRQQINAGEFRNTKVMEIIPYLRDDLKKTIDLYSYIQARYDYLDSLKVEERLRKAVRDYNRLINISIEEDETNG